MTVPSVLLGPGGYPPGAPRAVGWRRCVVVRSDVRASRRGVGTRTRGVVPWCVDINSTTPAPAAAPR